MCEACPWVFVEGRTDAPHSKGCRERMMGVFGRHYKGEARTESRTNATVPQHSEHTTRRTKCMMTWLSLGQSLIRATQRCSRMQRVDHRAGAILLDHTEGTKDRRIVSTGMVG